MVKHVFKILASKEKATNNDQNCAVSLSMLNEEPLTMIRTVSALFLSILYEEQLQ